MDHPVAERNPAHVDRRGRVVILVEDDAGLRRALERIVRTSGYDALVHASGESALADQAVDAADCLVVDLHLPAMSGLELVDHFRARGLRIPVIAITAHDNPGVRAAVAVRGVAHFVAKPFSGSALVRLLDRVIGAGADPAS